MSDTPRTDCGMEFDDSDLDSTRNFTRQLERELDAANERMKRLENAGNDLVWWFCQISELSSTQSAALSQWRNLRRRPNHE